MSFSGDQSEPASRDADASSEMPSNAAPPENVQESTGSERSDRVEGERGIPSVNRVRSLQSRVSSALAITLMSVLAGGLLIWYYAGALTRHSHAQDLAKAAQQRRAEGETALPALKVIQPLQSAAPAHESAVERVLGPPPVPLMAPEIPQATSNPYESNPTTMPPAKTPAELALDRRLGGPVLVASTNNSSQAMGMSTEASANAMPPMDSSTPSVLSASPTATPNLVNPTQSSGPLSLASLLRPTVTPTVTAQVLPTQRFLLPKGAFIDCTLETAINSSLPGMTTCVTATDTFSADSNVVLMERGTKLVGETRGQVQEGSPRLFVLWTEARTPAGVVVPLASPGTDELGRSGLSGTIDWHWWQRFGEAILVTVIDGAVQAASQSGGGSGGTVVFNPAATSEVTTEVLKGTLNIAPTIDKPQGDRIQILVARDVDFRSVYALQATATADR